MTEATFIGLLGAFLILGVAAYMDWRNSHDN